MNNKFPYPGLRPYEQNETDIFFGREEHTDQLLEKLGQTRFLAIVGPSGCGKSSLARAGLLAGLKAGFLSEAGIHWRIAEMRPGNFPYPNLAQALLDESILGNAYANYSTGDTNAASLQASLSRGPFSLHEILQNTPLPPDTQLLILVDQFEEIFRYYDRDKDNVNEAAAFVSLLLTTAQHTRAPTQTESNINIYVVITMRDEYLRDCAKFQGLPEAINQSIFLPPRLTRDQLREAIELPAQVFGDEVEPALVNRLLNKVSNDQDQLPVLQHALMRMWRLARAENPDQAILTLTHYEDIGGLEKALSQHADRAYAELDPAQQKIAETLFRNLTAPNNTRRPIRLGEIATLANVSSEQVVVVAEVFRQAGRSFLTPPLGKALTPNTVLDISHESLIWLWQRLKNWTDDEAESAKRYQRLEDNACHWDKGQAALWRTPDLEIALAWYKKKQPDAHWAKRYGKHFELAMRFLTESEMAQKKQKQRQKIWIGVAFGVISLFGGYSYFQWQTAKQLKQQVEQTKQKRTESLFDSHLTHTALLARVEDYAQAKQVLSKTYELEQKIPAPRHHARNLLAWFTELMGGEPLKEYDVGAKLFEIAVSPDGHFLAAAGEKGKLVLFNLNNGKLSQKQTLSEHEGNVFTIAFDPQAQWLASAGDDKQIIFWSLSTGTPIKQWTAPAKVKALAVSPDGKYLASGGEDQNITLREIETGTVRCTFKGHTKRISDSGIAFQPSGELLASTSWDNTARLWDVTSCQKSKLLIGHDHIVEKLAFSSDGKRLATSSRDKSIRLWNVESGKTLRVLQEHKASVQGLSFLKDKQLLVSGSEDLTLRVWDTESGVTLRVLQGHFAAVNGVTSYANKIFSAGNDSTIRVWDVISPDLHLVDLSDNPTVTEITPDVKSVAVGFTNGRVHLYSLPHFRSLWEKQVYENKIRDLTFNSNGTLLVVVSRKGKAKLLQVKDGTEKQTFSVHEKVSAVAFSPDSHIIATANKKKIGLFTVGEEPIFQPVGEEWILSVAFDNSGTRLLSIGVDKTTRLWSVDGLQLKLLKSFEAQGIILWASFSPDNQRIATVGREHLVRIYSGNDYQEEHRLKGHQNTIHRVIFSPDNQQVITMSADATVRFWDLSKGSELFTLKPALKPATDIKPAKSSNVVRDFDFRCTHHTPKNCWLAVPLTQGRLALYKLGQIYE